MSTENARHRKRPTLIKNRMRRDVLKPAQATRPPLLMLTGRWSASLRAAPSAKHVATKGFPAPGPRFSERLARVLPGHLRWCFVAPKSCARWGPLSAPPARAKTEGSHTSSCAPDPASKGNRPLGVPLPGACPVRHPPGIMSQSRQPSTTAECSRGVILRDAAHR
jgi:hypothetical protein